VAQLIFKLIFLLWIVVVRIGNLATSWSDLRHRFLLVAAILFASSVGIQLYYDFARNLNSTLRSVVVIVGTFLSLTAGLLAVIGKGKGRAVTTIASAGLALSWAVFP